MSKLTSSPVDQNDFEYNALFSDLQGNILKQHGRNHTANIFVKFDANRKTKAQEWINQFAERITSCKIQLRETEIYKRNNVSGGTFYNFFLSADGYRFFGQETGGFKDQSFLDGMKNSQDKLKDPSKDKWEKGFRDPIHAMILVADTDANHLGKICKEIIETVDDFGRILTIEYGNAIRNANGDGLEHFGYVDGISQPLFFNDEIERYKEKNTKPILFDPEAQLDLVLVKDPLVEIDLVAKKEGVEAYGSYFVFRKLEQHVKNFKKAEKELAEELIKKLAIRLKEEDKTLSDSKARKLAIEKFGDKERAGAMLVGRFEDGTPITFSEEDKMKGSGDFNNFDYSSDEHGEKCPFHAHIRKSNPRRKDDSASEINDKSHIMARRGITYGHRNVSTEVDPTLEQMPNEGVGLLFMSFQKSIENQFEFIQQNWVNNPDFLKNGVGIDPIIGQNGTDNISKAFYPLVYGEKINKKTCPVEFKSFVTLKGGEYFFAPSIHFLKNFKNQKP
jgi:Dyp-type peroxidase family